MRALLNVNVLIAILDSDHVHYRHARNWLNSNIEHGWATCPLTENGCIRILSSPAYPNPLPPTLIVKLLREATASQYHQFWPDSLSLLTPGVVDLSRSIGPKQITDIF